MGCSSPQNATIPNIPHAHLNRLLQVADINHPLNVNKKYEHLSKVLQDRTLGEGFKRTYGYQCVTTIEEMKSKRKQFWGKDLRYEETRVNGSPECWNAIRLAVEQPDQNTGRAILESVRVTMLKNNIQMCIDSRFNKYEVPIFCINMPNTVAKETSASKNLNMNYVEAPIKVKIRSVAFPNSDLVLDLNTKTGIGEVKSAIIEGKSLETEKGVRLFYNGRQMGDNYTLGNYNYSQGTIIQAMIR